MTLRGLTRDQLEIRLARKERGELLDLIHRLANLETFYTPAEIAEARRMRATTVLELMKAGTIRSHLCAHNRYRAPLSAVMAWDDETALNLEKNQDARARD
jgi:hypothetical protein